MSQQFHNHHRDTKKTFVIRLSFIFFNMRFAAQGLHLPHQPLRVLALHVLTTRIVRIVEVGVGLGRLFW